MYNLLWNNQALWYLVIYPFPACLESHPPLGCTSTEKNPGCISLERTLVLKTALIPYTIMSELGPEAL